MENTNNKFETKTDTTTEQTATSAFVSTGKTKKTSNKLLPVVIILAVLALTGIGFGVYGVMTGNTRVADLETQIAEKDQRIAELEGEHDGNDNANDVSNDNSSQLLTKNLLISSLEQYINGDHRPFIYELRSDFGEFYVFLERQVGGPLEGPEGDISQPTQLSGEIRRTEFNNLEKTERFEITGIDVNRIVDVFVGGFGNGMGNETMLFLMEDGTVEYMPIMKAYKEKNYRSHGKIPGVENVIKFMNGDYYHIPYGPYSNVFAQRADGKFYSLAEILYETGNY